MPQEDTYLTNLEMAQDESDELCDYVPDTEFDQGEENALTYLYGYICRKFLRNTFVPIVGTFSMSQIQRLIPQINFFKFSRLRM